MFRLRVKPRVKFRTKSMTSMCPKYYRHLTVTVNTGDRVYYVTGEVKQPGRQLYAGQMTVTKAITTAGELH